MSLLVSNERGFAHHFFLPVLAIIAVAGIGSYLLGVDHAQTTSCRTFYYKVGATNNSFGGAGSAKVCINYIQKILNGTYQANAGYRVVEDAYAKQAGVTEGYVTNDGSFGPITKSAVRAFQERFNNLSIDGMVGPQTWNAICGAGMHMPNADSKHPYENAAKGAAQHAGCTSSDKVPQVSTKSAAARIPTTTPVKKSPAITTFVAGPSKTYPGSYAERWTATNVTSCTLHMLDGVVDGPYAYPKTNVAAFSGTVPPRGYTSMSAATYLKATVISCSGPGGTVSAKPTYTSQAF